MSSVTLRSCRSISRRAKAGALLLSLSLLWSLVLPAARADEKKKEGKLKVVCSIYPVYDLTKRVAGELADVELFMPPGTDAHTFEPSAKDVGKLENANLFVYNGAGFEHWVKAVLKSSGRKDLHVVCASDAVPLLSDRISQKTGKRKKTDPGHDRKGHFDPHTWLTPENAKLEMSAIRDGLIEADPANKETYVKNFEAAAKPFDELQKEYTEGLKNLKHNKIVVAHEAFGYLCDAFHLEQEAIQGLEPGSEPTPTRIAEIIELVRKDNIKTVFFETGESSKTSETIAAETGVKIEVLRPMEFLTAEEEKAGDDLVSLFRKNLEVLKKALSE